MIPQPRKQLILPPGVKRLEPEEDEKPKREVEVDCARCTYPIMLDVDLLAEMRKEAGGRPIILAHEVCPDAEPDPPAHTYFIEIRILRDLEPQRPTEGPEAEALLAWFKADQEGDALVAIFEQLTGKLSPIWETLQSNLGILEQDDVAPPVAEGE